MHTTFITSGQVVYNPQKFPDKKSTITQNVTYDKMPRVTLNYYHPSFCGMKKNAFEGVDYYVVDKYKAPIEKFRTVDYLYEWADEQCDKIIEKDYYGRTPETMAQRVAMLDEWKDYFENENKEYSPTERLIIWNGITKNLKPNDDTIPPVLNKGVLADTIYNFKNDLKTNKNSTFNFSKIYENNLRAYYMTDVSTGETGTKWVVIKSKEHDPDNFKQNVEKLQMLSHKSWCTKSNAAEPYLEKGDFHVYLENGQPKIGIRFDEDNIAEIQGEKNNSQIPMNYFKKVKTYISDNKFELSKQAKYELSTAETKYKKLTKIKEYLKPIIDENDNIKLFNELGFNTESDENGNIILDKYGTPEKYDDFTVSELGIDEKKLFENVVKIKGDADFSKSTIHKFDNLKEVEGDLILLMNTSIDSLGSVEKIGGTLYATDTKLSDLGELTEVGNITAFDMKLKSLGKLKYINGSMTTHSTTLEDLGDLEFVGDELNLGYTKSLKTLGKLKHVGWNLYLRGSSIEDLGELESIGGELNLEETKNLKSLGKLKTVSGNLDLYNSSVEDLGMLESAKSIDIRETNIDSLQNIREIKFIKMKNKKQLKDLGALSDKSLVKYTDTFLIV